MQTNMDDKSFFGMIDPFLTTVGFDADCGALIFFGAEPRAFGSWTGDGARLCTHSL